MAHKAPSTSRPSRVLKPSPGFTLVELLVSMVVGVLVATSAFLALSSSFSSWSHIAGGGTLLETDRAMLRFERDIASIHPLPDRPFSGDASSLAIPLERDGMLRVASWSAEGHRLFRQERDYLFNNEAAFDGHAPDGSSLPVRSECYRLPAPAHFSFGDAGAPPATIAVSSPTNLPRTVTLSIGDFIRHCPTHLSAPDTP